MTDDSFLELVAWNLPRPLEGSSHNFKYRFAYVVREVCVLRYDNERAKAITAILGEPSIHTIFQA
jgi:Family of unknown function (DUF6516)